MKISVIVPIYNSEKYLYDSVNSILNQTEHDLEVLLINDGSTDSSEEICEELRKSDSRVRVFNKKNEGVSVARNFGFTHAKGEYISFVDADDYLCSDMYELLVRNLEENNADISICGVRTIYLNGKSDSNKTTGEKYILNQEEAIKYLLQGRVLNYGMWTKLAKRNILKDLLFEKGRKIGEDKFYFFQALLNSEIIVFEDENKYFYYKRENSATTSGFSEKIFDILYFSKKMEDIISEKLPHLTYIAKLNSYIENINMFRRIYIKKNARRIFAKELNGILEELIKFETKFKRDLPKQKRIELNLIIKMPMIYKISAYLYNKIKFGQ